MTRHEHGNTCPLGFTGRKRKHVWIETTMLANKDRSFSCDCCTAMATEACAGAGSVVLQPPFEIGEIVTRDGTDQQRVLEVGPYNDITVECIVEPKSKWCKVGEVELNLSDRYVRIAPSSGTSVPTDPLAAGSKNGG